MQNNRSSFKNEFHKRLIRFSLTVINLCDKLRDNRNLWSIADQLLRSGTSVGANIVEAKAASSKKDYIHCFTIALKSANETNYWLILVREYQKDMREEVETILKESTEITKIIGSGILTMKGRKPSRSDS